jgi:NAD-dependent SIR2 family protein deacetylase
MTEKDNKYRIPTTKIKNATFIAVGTAKLSRQACPYCHAELDSTMSFESSKPKPGDVSVCAECGEIAVFDENLEFRIPTPEELETIMALRPDFDDLRFAVLRMKQLGFKW